MDYSQLYSKYYSRMSKEGWLKSFVYALIVGFSVNFVIALVTWLVGFNAGLWIALGGLVVVTVAVMPMFYFGLFRPNETKVAKRLDSLGMEERIVTMQELQGDESTIAALQRADTVSFVAAVDRAYGDKDQFVKYDVNIGSIIAAICVGVFWLIASVLTGLFGLGFMKCGKDLGGKTNTYSVTYGVQGVESDGKLTVVSREKLAAYMAYKLATRDSQDEDGNDDKTVIPAYVTIGETSQSVKEGGSSKEILYTAKNYYYFVKWVDSFGNEYGYEDGYTPSRHEDNVNYDIELKAHFEKVDECNDDLDLWRYFDGSETSAGPGTGSSGNPGNESYELNRYDFIIDGNTKYMTDYEMYYDLAMKYLSGSDDISAEERAMIETYFEILK